MDFKHISFNFEVAKVLAILMVTVGHYFGGILWIPTTYALFVFAYSSGYFTGRKYTPPVAIAPFWKAKIARLLLPILVIDVFLLVLFLAQDKEGIFSWQTLPSMFGVSGFLVWFKLGNPSPFGAGMWFFTLLLLFYLFCPLIAWFNAQRVRALSGLLGMAVLTCYLHYAVPLGHSLWLTLFAFWFGAWAGVWGFKVPVLLALVVTVIAAGAMMFLNVVKGFGGANYPLIWLASMGIIALLMNLRLPRFGLDKVLLLSGCVLQIYFIHGYLFLHDVAGNKYLDFVLSLGLVIVCAWLLAWVTERINGLLAR